MYRYQLRLRLSRALLELPHCNDITGLALDLGFYSHSHFSNSFRKAFGMTPSSYRAMIGTRQIQSNFIAALENGQPRRCRAA
jgi:AraC-like DNA-binding protein